MTIYDRSVALRHAGGDPELLAQLLQMFLDQAPERLGKLEGALRRQDAQILEQEAHALKGTAATLGMAQLRDAAYTVERLGSERKIEAAPAAVAEIGAALSRVLATLEGEGTSSAPSAPG